MLREIKSKIKFNIITFTNDKPKDSELIFISCKITSEYNKLLNVNSRLRTLPTIFTNNIMKKVFESFNYNIEIK